MVEQYMKGWLYILKNEETNRFYIGSTNDYVRRIKQHKAGYTRTTRILKTFTLVYLESFDSIEKARLRERKLKHKRAASSMVEQFPIKEKVGGPNAPGRTQKGLGSKDFKIRKVQS